VLSFIVAFGLSKAVTDLVAGVVAERSGGRQRLLIVGWLLALPVPLLIWLALGWWLVVVANLFLGANQGLAWSMTVRGLAGPGRHRLAAANPAGLSLGA
jgi:hypothetical protein